VGGTQNHAGRLSGLQGFLPTRRTQAPPITGFQTGKSKFLLRSGEVVRDLENSRNSGVITAQTV
jgi:hypothetical protein